MTSASEKEKTFQIIALTPAGSSDPSIAVAAAKSGCLGVLDLEYAGDLQAVLAAIESLSRSAGKSCGIKMNGEDAGLIRAVAEKLPSGISTVILTQPKPDALIGLVELFHAMDRTVFLEVTSAAAAREGASAGVDALIAKGHEAGGFVGEKTAFILLQQVLSVVGLPVYVQGGIGLHTAAACYAAGAAGVVLDTQLLLTGESHLPEEVKRRISKLDGSETRIMGGNANASCRVYLRPGSSLVQKISDSCIRAEVPDAAGQTGMTLREAVQRHLSWSDVKDPLWPIGQDAGIAADLAGKYSTVGSLVRAFKRAVTEHAESARRTSILGKESLLAQSHGTLYPVVQGPMARISDSPEFASLVAGEGGLPFIALSQLTGDEIKALLPRVQDALNGRPWGVGLLGFNKEELFAEQIEALVPFSPPFAIIAGALPHQVALLEARGISTYVHVPSPDILDMFLDAGAKRFIFEGSECGGHIGPRSSFVLWDIMTGKLLRHAVKNTGPCDHYHVLYAGGIHDARSASMVAALSAPLARTGMRIGIQMGTAYLLTPEIVQSGAILEGYQGKVLECLETSVLEFSPGHALRCCPTPFVARFEGKKRELIRQQAGGKELADTLGRMILGKSRIAAKGLARAGERQGPTKPSLISVDCAVQHEEGLYMTGQVAALHDRTRTIRQLHEDVTVRACEKLNALLPFEAQPRFQGGRPCDIAIIGMACLFPKAGDLRTYWRNILEKKSSISEIPSDRWDWRLYFDENRHARDKIYSKWGGFLDDLPFDPTRYGMPPKSVQAVDPAQLMALETARRCLADAGYEDREFDRETTSVILGASGGGGDVGMQYCLRSEFPRFFGNLPDEVGKRLPEWSEDTFAGILLNVITGRIANRFNLGGVNFATDAACASSLAAVYQAVGELVAGRSSMVIAGGVDTGQGPFGYMCFSKTQALSPRGRCSAFDAEADGIVISEGIAMVALKRLEDAERDYDRIYAVIKGAGGSSDGKARGLTAPDHAGQMRAMQRAYEQAGFEPETIGLFEAHGTGTVVGDTTELESTSALLEEAGTPPRSSAIGSVKSLIGHTKAAAGAAGLIKSALSLYHRVLPPHAGVDRPNAVLERPNCPLYLPDQPLPWLSSEDRPRRAAVSGFGFGGTNFHVVLEEHDAGRKSSPGAGSGRAWPAELLLWHGSDQRELQDRMLRTRQEIENEKTSGLAEAAFRLAKSYQSGAETAAIVATDVEDACRKIRAAADFPESWKKKLPAGVYYSGPAGSHHKTAVLFPGQGSQYTGMAVELSLTFPVFADTISEAEQILREPLERRFGRGKRLSTFLYPRACYTDRARNEATKALTSTDIAQPALGAISAGCWRLMQSFGLRADIMGGHSYGEFTALFAGGALDFDAFMALSEARGRIIVNTLKGNGREFGTMAAVRAPRNYVEKVLLEIDGLVIANHNAPEQCVISGSTAAIDRAAARISQDKVSVVKIPVAAAFHSDFMEPARTCFAELIGKMPWRSPAVPVYSNTHGKLHAQDAARLVRTMAEHLVRPVEFVSEIEAMYRDGARVFLELGPKTVLTKLIDATLAGRPHTAVAIDGNGGGITGMLHAFGQLLCAGVSLDAARLFEGRCREISNRAHASGQQAGGGISTAWLLNGSRARPAADPPKQIGVRADEPANAAPDTRAALSVTEDRTGGFLSQTASPARGLPGGPLPDALKSRVTGSERVQAADRRERTDFNELFQRRVASRRRLSDNLYKGGREQMSMDDEPAVMATYFDMMRQFLETQERIMSMYMNGTPVERRPGPRLQRQIPALTAPGNGGAKRSQPMSLRIPDCTPLPHSAAEDESGSARRSEIRTERTQERLQTAPPPGMQDAAARIAVPPAPDTAAAASDPGKSAARLGREELSRMLLGIIEEKTGYPPDMIGVNQNLEADLGIDSIKRVEIVGALMKALPQRYGQALGKDLGGLNTQPTLSSMLDILDKAHLAASGGHDRPFDHAGMRSAAPGTSHSFRHIIAPCQEPVPQDACRSLCPGHFIITRDSLGVADRLYQLLRERGRNAGIVEREVLKDEDALNQWCQSLKAEPVAGIVHLAQIGSDRFSPDSSIEGWRVQLQVNEKSLYSILHALGAGLKSGCHVLSASSLGGLFGRNTDCTSGLSLQGGGVGLLKSFRREREGIRVKAVDVDPARSVDEIAACLVSELELEGGRQEVGYPGGERTIFTTVPAPAAGSAAPSSQDQTGSSERPLIESNLVILATGGSKGVTAELLREVALPGNTLILTGRSALQEREADEVSALTTDLQLRDHFVSQVRAGGPHLSPAEIRRRVKAVLAAREMRNTIDDFRKRGARVEYHPVDVTDEESVRRLFEDIYDRHGRISGVIHGAGVIEDKLLADKKSDSWSRVVETKVIGLLLILKYLRPEPLRFFMVMSSVAGRYGNSGQSDYATANEVMNRLCCQASGIWKNTVNVKALCWGPWGPTTFGTGMVTPETEAKFAEKGVSLVTCRAGRDLFRSELTDRSGTVEIICGEAPWEQGEILSGAVRRRSEAAEASRWPFLESSRATAASDGRRSVTVCLDRTHSYLEEHRIDGVRVLPAAAALEMMSQAAGCFWPGWKVVEAIDCRMLKGIEVREQNLSLNVVVTEPVHDADGGFELTAEIQSGSGSGLQRAHYRSVLRCARSYPEAAKWRPAQHAEKNLTVARAYGEWLFHGPRFQVIEDIMGLSGHGARALVRTTAPSDWMLNAGSSCGVWAFDPALLDAAAQMALLWARAYKNESALPSKFGRVTRHSAVFPGKLSMHYELISDVSHVISADVFFTDADNNVVLKIGNMECVSSPALNRLGGTAGPCQRQSGLISAISEKKPESGTSAC